MHWRNLITAGAAVLLVACTHLGPQTVPRDRFDYNAAISNSWKEQTLLMILFSLTESGGKEGLPLVTIPAS